MSLSLLPPVAVNCFIVLFGLVMGSFLNVVIYRMPRERSIVRPRSECTACHAPLSWSDNIPLLSYLFLRGKCGSCGVKISARYPLVEILTAVLFWFSWRDLGLDVAQFRIWFFIFISIAIIFIDLDFRIIPDELSLGGWAVGILTAYWDFRNGLGHLVLASITGFGIFFLFGLVYERLTGRVGLGGGDIKFMGTIGAFLGFGGLWSTLLISSILGSIIGLGYGWWQAQKEKNAFKMAKAAGAVQDAPLPTGILRSAIPYGPFLVAGALIELFFEVSKWMSL